jgi:hypothetical protein
MTNADEREVRKVERVINDSAAIPLSRYGIDIVN